MFRWSTLVLLGTDAIAKYSDSLDEASMLQMPTMIEKDLEADEDASECHCPGYFKEQCEAEAAQGCVWSDDGDSNGQWCQCGEIPETLPPPSPVPLPVPAPPPLVTQAEEGEEGTDAAAEESEEGVDAAVEEPPPASPVPSTPVPAPPPVNPETATALVTLRWNGGSLAIPEGEEGCLGPGLPIGDQVGYPNDGLTGITDLRPGCEVEFFQHGGCTGTITVMNDEASDTALVGISGVIVTCTPGLATLHWNGGSIRIPEGQEGCLGPGQSVGHQGGYPNDMLTGVADLRPGCAVEAYQHEGCTGTVTTMTDESNDLYNLGISGVIVTCSE